MKGPSSKDVVAAGANWLEVWNGVAKINQVEKRCSLGTVLCNGSDQMLRVSAD